MPPDTVYEEGQVRPVEPEMQAMSQLWPLPVQPAIVCRVTTPPSATARNKSAAVATLTIILKLVLNNGCC